MVGEVKKRLKLGFKLPIRAKNKWVKALRSGEFKQGTGFLEQQEENWDTEETFTSYCCLGVARKIGLCKRTSDPRDEYVSNRFLPRDIQQRLSEYNDGPYGKPKWSFNRIATWIEKNL